MGLFNDDCWMSAAIILEAGASADCYNERHEQLIDIMASNWVAMKRQHAESPLHKESWETSRWKVAWEKLVVLLSERGYDLKTSSEEISHRNETVDGMPYLKWRRMQRGHLDFVCGGTTVELQKAAEKNDVCEDSCGM
jgi:hypothetical protein